MPAKRTKPKTRQVRITPAALEAYRSGDWPMLHRSLGLKPWEASPLDVEKNDESIRPGSPWGTSVAKALQLRRQLEAVAQETGSAG